ncbi:hypothetical protein M1196_23475, partial [Salmonella enterica subsp. enterica serovar Oranienburg]
NLDLHALSTEIDMAGYTADSGNGSIESWLDWRDARVVRSLTRFHLRDVKLSNPDGASASADALDGLAEVAIGKDSYT